jgi:replicative DNA helicase
MKIELYSESGEKAVIGSVLISPDAYLNVAEFLAPEDFFLLRHNYIWDAFRQMELKKTSIDTVTLSKQLQDMGKLAEVGGPAYLTKLINETPTHRHAEVYGRMVKRIALRRELLNVGDAIKLLAEDESIPVESIFEHAEKELFAVTGYGLDTKPTDMMSITSEFADEMEELIANKRKGINPGVPTGFYPVDDIISGSFKKEVLVLAGVPKLGKSTANLNIIRNRLKAGFKIVLFITEMLRSDVMRKFVAMETGIPVMAMKNGAMNDKQHSMYFEAMVKISTWKLDIIDSYRKLTPLDIRRQLRKLSRQGQIDVVSIDGLWQMRSEKVISQRNDELTDIMESIIDIAKDFNVPIDVVHQLSRSAENRQNKRPRNSDLSGSTGIEQNVYTIIFLYRENFYAEHGDDLTEVIVSANRTGPTGIAKLQFDNNSETYSEVKPKGFNRKVIQQPIVDANRKDIHQ